MSFAFEISFSGDFQELSVVRARCLKVQGISIPKVVTQIYAMPCMPCYMFLPKIKVCSHATLAKTGLSHVQIGPPWEYNSHFPTSISSRPFPSHLGPLLWLIVGCSFLFSVECIKWQLHGHRSHSYFTNANFALFCYDISLP